MRKLTTLALTGMLFASTAVMANAHHQDGHEANYYGLCTAYFSGSEKGQEKKQENGQAFIVFRETIGDYDGDGDEDNDDVRAFCGDVAHPGGNGGGNGRNG
jgi:hypothetical protein